MLIQSKEKMKILFLCTGNSCRSQMAEGWARKIKGSLIEPYSAGTKPQGINPFAVKVMAEVGIDIKDQGSKHVDTLTELNFNYLVTVCDSASEACPVFSRDTIKIHVGFEDPPKLAETARTEEEALTHYRRVRDEIKKFIETLPESLNEKIVL